MKWFKWISKSRNDVLIRDLISLFGLVGEHVFWRTLELMADEFNVKTPGYNKFLVESWRKNYEVSYKKTIKVLQYFQHYPDKKKRIFFKIRGVGKKATIQLNCPKLRELCDNWTQKQLKKTTKSHRSKDDVTCQQEEEEEVEVDIKKKIYKKKKIFIRPYLGEFKNIKLTQEEHQKLKNGFPNSFKHKIENISHYIESKGDKYKSHYATILNWDRREKKETADKTLKPKTYAQAQDAERREMCKMIKNLDDDEKETTEGTDKITGLLPTA